MSTETLAWVLSECEARGFDRLVMIALADEADDNGTKCFPSLRLIARKARISVGAASEAIDRLERDGEVVVWRPNKTGRGRHNYYALVKGRPLEEVVGLLDVWVVKYGKQRDGSIALASGEAMRPTVRKRSGGEPLEGSAGEPLEERNARRDESERAPETDKRAPQGDTDPVVTDPSKTDPRAKSVDSVDPQAELVNDGGSPNGSPRERDALFEALVFECYPLEGEVIPNLTKSERGRINAACKELREIGAEAAQVSVVAGSFRAKYPNASVTAQAIVGHWTEAVSVARALAEGRPTVKLPANDADIAGWPLSTIQGLLNKRLSPEDRARVDRVLAERMRSGSRGPEPALPAAARQVYVADQNDPEPAELEKRRRLVAERRAARAQSPEQAQADAS